MVLLNLLYLELILSSFVCGFTTKGPLDVLNDLLKAENHNVDDLGDAEYIEEVYRDIEKNEGVSDQQDHLIDRAEPFQFTSKKSNFKPKYNPGWKFIGLGKRPLKRRELEFNGNYPQKDIGKVFKKTYPNNKVPLYPGSKQDGHDNANPLLVSSLINFEIFSAIRDAARETTKKEFNESKVVSVMDSSSNRPSGRFGLFGGQQKVAYDPGWMLIGLGK